MRVIRVVLGVFGLLLALFAGGCTLLFAFEMFSEIARGLADGTAFLPFMLILGVLPAVLGGLLAWWAFRRRPPSSPPAGDRGP